MKRAAIAFCSLFFCCGALLANSPDPQSMSRERPALLQELVRLTRAGSSDVTVLAYAKAHRLELPPEVSDAELRWLRDSGVSELVVRYMTAIDVRISGEGTREDAASGSYEDAAHPRAAYSYPESDYEGDAGGYPDRYAGSYPDSSYDLYSGEYGYDPFYGYGYSPYPVYFFIGRDGFLHRFHGRVGRFRGDRGFDRGRAFRGHRGGFVGHRGGRDTWRERGFGRRPGSSMVVSPRGSGRSAFVRGGFGVGAQGPRGRVTSPRGFGPSGSQRFSHPGSSGGSHTGGGLGRSPRVPAGPSGGRGRH